MTAEACAALEPLIREGLGLQDVAEDRVRALVERARLATFRAGEFVFREGGAADTLYLIRSGRVAVEVHVPGKGTIQLDDVGTGGLLGWSWLFPPHLRHADGRAVKPVEAVAFDGATLRALMARDHDLGYAIAMRVAAELHERLQEVRMQRLDLYRAEP